MTLGEQLGPFGAFVTDPHVVCACGCGQKLLGRSLRARYFSDACRVRAWKERTGYQGPMKPAQTPEARPERSRTPAKRRSGLQVSYEKAAGVLEVYLRQTGKSEEYARWVARTLMRKALSDRQRLMLDEKGW